MNKRIFGVLLMTFCLTVFLSVDIFGEEGAGNVCAECHDEVSVKFIGTAHGISSAKCIDCHGNAAKHLDNAESGNIFSFKNETALQKSKQCLSCHKTVVGGFMNGEHSKAGIDCTKCHGVHKKVNSMAKLNTKLCTSCHQDVATEFMLNEKHRLAEGILECTSCHNPHESAARQRLGGFKQESCLKCHRDKGGPFMHEHEASSVEGCTACHDVHGSPNRHMLKHQSVRELCFSCHSVAPDWHLRFLANDTNCANCHSSIHGSNLDKLFLK